MKYKCFYYLHLVIYYHDTIECLLVNIIYGMPPNLSIYNGNYIKYYKIRVDKKHLY